ncbi:auxin-induced protein 15A-like [Prunus dulcis]|uniref:auxin-induced protein 15A-like n=1 Tax=Prunus dulcis TaxID=3755 RepID=UPI001481D464|nr:auxin-induced protein 15A-like [Prunus dulcis]
MGFRLPGIFVHAKKNKVPSKSLDVPKGYFAVYVGEGEKKRFVIPVSYLNQPSFQDLLTQAEDEFGYDHPMGAITIPCSENTFLDLTSSFGV